MSTILDDIRQFRPTAKRPIKPKNALKEAHSSAGQWRKEQQVIMYISRLDDLAVAVAFGISHQHLRYHSPRTASTIQIRRKWTSSISIFRFSVCVCVCNSSLPWPRYQQETKRILTQCKHAKHAHETKQFRKRVNESMIVGPTECRIELSSLNALSGKQQQRQHPSSSRLKWARIVVSMDAGYSSAIRSWRRLTYFAWLFAFPSRTPPA